MSDKDIVLPVMDYENNPFWVCTMCYHLARAAQRGELSKGCGHMRCHSPYEGSCFTEYEGPLTEDMLKQWCFVCGDPSDHLIQAADTLTPFGVCAKHAPDAIEGINVIKLGEREEKPLTEEGEA